MVTCGQVMLEKMKVDQVHAINFSKSITIQLISVAFDPASFYGHHEFDLAIADMFGGFTKEFYDAYHSLIPKEPGFETRHKLYLLFHYLNHWYGSTLYWTQAIFVLLGTILEWVIDQMQSHSSSNYYKIKFRRTFSACACGYIENRPNQV